MSEAGNPQETRTGAYRVLARKYRPSDFSGLIGQEPMVRTLTNAFAAGRLAQAWMLTGVRGVGKTTTARVLARALNYKTAEIDRPTVELSAIGEHCQAIMDGRHPDVIEMDAASHTGIDDIRDIIEQVRYAPVAARFKVYIIDEVHMLSTQAFNGLLKTLEEPPPHVKFIFATTEIRKVPITVLSRCQRFDLRRIDAQAIREDLARISTLEGIEAEPDALAMIARAAEGSMRDAQSILDQAIAHGAGNVTAEAVRAMLGLADRARVIDLFEHVMKGEVAAALAEYRLQYDAGADPATVLSDLAAFTHLVTRLRFVPGAEDDASLSEDEKRRGTALAGTLSVRVLSRCWQMLLKGIPEVQAAGRPVDAGEMVLIRLAHAAELPAPDELIRMLDGQGAGGDRDASAATSRRPSPASETPVAMAPPPLFASVGASGGQTMRQLETAPAVEAEIAEPAVPLTSLADIAASAESRRDMAFKVRLKQFVRPIRIDDGRLDISLTPEAPKTFVSELNEKLAAWTGRRWVVSVSREPGGPTMAEEESAKRNSVLTDAASDPSVAAVLARFPGAKIIDVRFADTVVAETAVDALLTDEVPSDEDDFS